MKNKFNFALVIIFSCNTASAFYVEGSGWSIAEAKNNTRLAAASYCSPPLEYVPTDKVWIKVQGSKTCFNTNRLITCSMNFECLDIDTEEGRERMEEIVESIE